MEVKSSINVEKNEYRQWKKWVEELRLERLEKKKKREKLLQEIHLLKAQARREYNTNLHITGKAGPTSRKAIEAYELQQQLMLEE